MFLSLKQERIARSSQGTINPSAINPRADYGIRVHSERETISPRKNREQRASVDAALKDRRGRGRRTDAPFSQQPESVTQEDPLCGERKWWPMIFRRARCIAVISRLGGNWTTRNERRSPELVKFSASFSESAPPFRKRRARGVQRNYTRCSEKHCDERGKRSNLYLKRYK